MKKRLLSLLLALALLLSVLPQLTLPIRAEDEPVYSGKCGNFLHWTYNPNSGCLTITGYGVMEDYQDYNEVFPPWRSFADQITEIDLRSGIQAIGSFAFKGFTNITSVDIPSTVVSIGRSAFSGCSRLQTLVLPDGLTRIDQYAFQKCSNLMSVELPGSLSYLGSGAFDGCSLTEITIPASVTEIGRDAFTGCEQLTVTVSEGSYAEKYCKDNHLNYKRV